MHHPIPEQGGMAEADHSRATLAYFAVPTNSRARLERSGIAVSRPLATHASGGAARRMRFTWERMDEAGRTIGSRNREDPSSLAQQFASPSNTQGRSRMREFRLSGSVRGASSNGRPYRERGRMRSAASEGGRRCAAKACASW